MGQVGKVEVVVVEAEVEFQAMLQADNFFFPQVN